MLTGSMDTDNPKALSDAACIRVPHEFTVDVLLSDVLRR